MLSQAILLKQNYRTGSFFFYNKSGAHSWCRLVAEQAHAFSWYIGSQIHVPKDALMCRANLMRNNMMRNNFESPSDICVLFIAQTDYLQSLYCSVSMLGLLDKEACDLCVADCNLQSIKTL